MLCTRCNTNPIKYKERRLCAGCYVTLYRRGEIQRTAPVVACSNPNCRGIKPTKFVKGLCKACYYRKRSKGTLDYTMRPGPMPCKFPECGKLSVAHGFCDTHRKRIERHDNVETGRPPWWGDKRAKKDRANAKLRSLPKRDKKDKSLRKKFKISISQYEEMLTIQNGKCAICKGLETRIDHRTKKPMALAVDHCNVTGKIRELLCASHNTGLGLFGHSIELLESAIAYLRKHQ